MLKCRLVPAGLCRVIYNHLLFVSVTRRCYDTNSTRFDPMSLIRHLHSSVLCRTSASVQFTSLPNDPGSPGYAQSNPSPGPMTTKPDRAAGSQFSRCLAGQSVSGSPRSSTVMTDSPLSKRALFLLFRFWMIRKSMPLQRGVTDLFLLGASSRAFLILLAFLPCQFESPVHSPHIHALRCWATYIQCSLISFKSNSSAANSLVLALDAPLIPADSLYSLL